jgi:hypothetical protein
MAPRPVITVAGELAHDDPEPDLPASQRAGYLEPRPGGRERDARRASEVAGICVVQDGERYLLRFGRDLGPDVERFHKAPLIARLESLEVILAAQGNGKIC